MVILNLEPFRALEILHFFLGFFVHEKHASVTATHETLLARDDLGDAVTVVRGMDKNCFEIERLEKKKVSIILANTEQINCVVLCEWEEKKATVKII